MKKLSLRLIGAYLNTLAIFSPKLAGKIGYNIFRTPQAPPVTEKHHDFFNSGEKESFEYEGNKIQTYRWGHGPLKILFLHGWQSHSFRWKKYIEAFSQDEFTLYALDAPAHGLSEGKYIHLPLYTKVVDIFIQRIQPVHAVVTHSFGGLAILHAFHVRPNLTVDKLVLTAVPGESSEFIKEYRNLLGLTNRTVKAVQRLWITEIQHPPEYFSTVKFAAEVSIPGLLIHDKDDLETSYAYAVKVHEAWKNSKLIATEGLGHNLKSIEVVKWIKDFISEP